MELTIKNIRELADTLHHSDVIRFLLRELDKQVSDNKVLHGRIRDGERCECCVQYECDCMHGITWGGVEHDDR